MLYKYIYLIVRFKRNDIRKKNSLEIRKSKHPILNISTYIYK